MTTWFKTYEICVSTGVHLWAISIRHHQTSQTESSATLQYPVIKFQSACILYMGVSKNRAPKMDTFIIENPIKMDDLGGPPLFSDTSIWYNHIISQRLPFSTPGALVLSFAAAVGSCFLAQGRSSGDLGWLFIWPHFHGSPWMTMDGFFHKIFFCIQSKCYRANITTLHHFSTSLFVSKADSRSRSSCSPCVKHH